MINNRRIIIFFLVALSIISITLSVWLIPIPATATGNIIAAPDTADAVGTYTSLAMDSNGNPVVSYRDETNDDLKILHCNDPNCIGGDESIIDPDFNDTVGEGSSLALDANGNPVVSYFYGNTSDLRVLHCIDANCTGTKPTTPT